MVARQLGALGVHPGHRVLEIDGVLSARARLPDGLFQRLDRTPDISEFEADLADAVGE